MIEPSQLFDAFALVEFGDAGGARISGPPLPEEVRKLAAYLGGDDALAGVLGTPTKVKAWIELLTRDLADVEVTISERGIIALRVGKVAWPVVLFRATVEETRICRLCGCTDELGCEGGCTWSTPSLCSRCVAVKAIARIHADNSRRGPGRGGRWCP